MRCLQCRKIRTTDSHVYLKVKSTTSMHYEQITGIEATQSYNM